MRLSMGVTLSYGKGEVSENLLYYGELIVEWELALPSVTKGSLGTYDILRIALVQWRYTFLR